jgi:uncharacterized protein DUF3168
MNEELQRALYTLVSAGLAPMAVYGATPQDSAWPYVVIGTPNADTQDTNDSDGALVRVPVRLYSAQGALAASGQFVDQVRQLLHHTEALVLTSATVVTVYVEGSQIEEPSEDGKARETVVTVAILVDDITPGTD